MFPFLDLHFIKIPMYGLCIVVGGIIGCSLVCLICKKLKKNILDFIIVAAVGIGFSFVFAKLFYIFVTYPINLIPKLIYKMFTDPKNFPMSGGFVFYGGVFGGALGYFVGTKIAKCKFTDFNETLTFLVAFVHSFGRLGCFCAGCCYGIHYNGPFAIRYVNPISPVEPNVGIFPVQLLESALLMIFAITMFILIMKNKKVTIFYYTIYYSIVRFCLEYLRGDVERGKLWIFSTSQWISIFLFVASIICIVVLGIVKRNRKLPANQPADGGQTNALKN